MTGLRLVMLGIAVAVLLGQGAAASTTPPAAPFDPGRAPFTISIDGIEMPYRVFAWYVLPGDPLKVRGAERLVAAEPGGAVRRVDGGHVVTAADEPGLYRLYAGHGDAEIRINLFVMRPAAALRDGRIGAYRIGDYPRRLFRGLQAYAPPEGFIEVSAEHREVEVSPHFRVGQFLSKQASGWPKYALLRPELIIKLERILEQVNRAGIRTDGLTVMSGFRTPWYNRAIGNRTSSSRHLYGGAADIFIDVDPQDGVMDDLNGDGRVTKADAVFLYDLLEGWSTRPWYRRFAGGLGVYGSTPAHGPFVHVDARGYRARWGR